MINYHQACKKETNSCQKKIVWQEEFRSEITES